MVDGLVCLEASLSTVHSASDKLLLLTDVCGLVDAGGLSDDNVMECQGKVVSHVQDGHCLVLLDRSVTLFLAHA